MLVTTSRIGTPPCAFQRIRFCRIPISQPIAKPYERVPQVTVNGYADWRGFERPPRSKARGSNTTLETGNRYIADVRAAYPILAPGWFIVPRARVSSTAYDLDPHFTQATRRRPGRCRY